MDDHAKIRFAHAALMLGKATNGRFDIYAISGDRNVALRAEIISTLTGFKVPKSKAGVHALAKEFFRATAIDKLASADCLAAKEDHFRDFCEGFFDGFEFADPALTMQAHTLLAEASERERRINARLAMA